MAYTLILSGLILAGALIALCLALYTQQNEINRLESELKMMERRVELVEDSASMLLENLLNERKIKLAWQGTELKKAIKDIENEMKEGE